MCNNPLKNLLWWHKNILCSFLVYSHFKIFALYLYVLYFIHGGPTTMGPTCHRLHLIYIASHYFIHSPPLIFSFPPANPTNHSFPLLNHEAKKMPQKSEWERGQHMGGCPTTLGRPPSHLLLYKKPFLPSLPYTIHNQFE